MPALWVKVWTIKTKMKKKKMKEAADMLQHVNQYTLQKIAILLLHTKIH